MTFATPWLFGAAVAASLMVGILHLLSVRRPPVLALPTARFVTGGDARAVARRPRPNDLLLLMLRVLALLAAGAALAGIQLEAGRARTVRLVMVDSAAATDSSWRVRQLTGAGAPLSAAKDDGDVESQLHAVADLARDPARAVVRATQLAAALATDRPELEQVELTVVIPDHVETLEGWEAWRAQWPGAITVQRAAPAGSVVGGGDGATGVAQPSGVASAMNDAATVAMTSLFGGAAPDPQVTIVWPQDGAPAGWRMRQVSDTVSAVAAQGQALVGPFVRVADAPPVYDVPARRALAWWSDGAPAVVEERVGGRCLRSVGIRVPAASDLLLSAPAEGLLRALRAPCAVRGLRTDSLRGNDPGRGRAAASAFRAGVAGRTGTRPAWLGPILLLFALALLGAEWLVRRGEST